jgi:hypothetical protein
VPHENDGHAAGKGKLMRGMLNVAALSADHVTFEPRGIYSGHGFWGGALLYDPLHRWGESQGFDLSRGDGVLLDGRRLLWHAYHRFVARPSWEQVAYAPLGDNPVRAQSGWELDDYGEPPNPEALYADDVTVAMAEIHRLCGELFPLRARGWLTLHHALASLYPAGPPAALLGYTPDSADPSRAVWADAADSLAAIHQLDDEGCELLGTLLSRSVSGLVPWERDYREPSTDEIVRLAEAACGALRR